jgi:hypothetical protein
MPGIGFELPVHLSPLECHPWAIKGLSEWGRLTVCRLDPGG